MDRKLLALLLIPLLFPYCSSRFGFHDPGTGDARERFSVYYSEPGRDEATMVDKHVDDELIRLIDNAERYLFLAAYNFNRDSIVQAVLRARLRNLDVRFVGDIDEFYTSGYQALFSNGVNMTLGNATAIQHNKFAVIDDKFLFTGTGNLSDTDMVRNNNNWYIIQNENVVKLYKDEFLQMHAGLFGVQKRQRNNTTSISINNSPVEIYFSPYLGDTAMDRIITLVESATTSIHYMIFAHTHDELSAALIKMARQRGIPVYGIHDSTFITGVSQEAPRLYAAGFAAAGALSATGPFIRWDGNENTAIKNNPTHGGKMHCKTILIDAGTPNARMATGSFNWSTNAIQNNDENLLIINQARIVNTIYEQWKGAWGIANDMALKVTARGSVASPGDIIISEIGWAGASDGSTVDRDDDFVEVFNNASNPIDMSHWSIQWGTNDKRNLYPIPDDHNWYYENRGSCAIAGFTTPQPNIICPGQVRIFYNKKPSAFAETGADEQITYDDQGGEIRNASGGSISTEHFKLSGTKNFRLNASQFKLRLYDKSMRLIDEAGDGFTAAAGVYDDYNSPRVTQSMERRGYSSGAGRFTTYQSGSLPSAWFTHLTAETYSCVSRQDYNVAAPPDGCLSKAANTYSSAGYTYTNEANPMVRRLEALSTSQIKVTFDSNMTAAGTNCTGLTTKIAVTLTAGGCGAPTVSAITAGSNNSEVIVTLSTNLMTTPSCRYLVAPAASCVDSLNHSANGSTLHVNAPAGSFATAIINEICVTGCPAGIYSNKDWAEIKITAPGTTRGLKLYFYNESELRQIYEFNDMYATTGSILSVGIAQAAFLQADRTAGTLSFPMAISLRELTGFDATDGAFILTYCATGENDTVDTSKAECNLPYKGLQDAVYYSDRDGTLSQGMVAGALTHFYENLQSFWPQAERPIYGLNDRSVQLTGACIAADSSAVENAMYFCTNTGSGIGRSAGDLGTVKNSGKNAWRLFSAAGLTASATNTGW